MIVVKVELWPLGSEAKATELGRMYIANDGTGDAERGSYDVAVCRKGYRSVPAPIDKREGAPRATRVGRVENYPRLAYNMWRLITRALKSAFPEES